MNYLYAVRRAKKKKKNSAVGETLAIVRLKSYIEAVMQFCVRGNALIFFFHITIKISLIEVLLTISYLSQFAFSLLVERLR